MSIVDRIRDEAKKYGMTIASIERDTHISNGTIRKWNKSVPSVESLYKVANLLHCSMEYLLMGVENNIYTDLTLEEKQWLDLFHQLSPVGRIACQGYATGYIDAQSEDL